jgi:hypothetical protein
MTRAVSRWSITAEAQVRARVNLCGIYGVQSGTGTDFSLSSSVSPRQYHSTVSLQLIWGMSNMFVRGSSSET